ncbi:hypothetical protein [Xanthomonas theicola]|uniref:Lipoprotein n=1 Tax=Xanthomonas theicola TaxID=56464 RepID=A0A2S6ZCT1_9XANT|nr:hypothetical protein [Xanthomonas theicola]PPT87792.1 hypothetical protein XthCFBP4691_14965 [Xanthomonas theicola]QNH26495.1 hypothetical protein G4Q83_19665 [Xanthomonas theicola]
MPVLFRCVAAAVLSLSVASAGPALAVQAASDTSDILRFQIREGHNDNLFYRHGPVAAHALLTSGTQPRLLAAFPAGNSGAGLWFEASATPVQWQAQSELRELVRADARGRTLRGVALEASSDAATLTVREAVLGSVRVLRDFQALGKRPDAVAAAPLRDGRRLRWARDRLDGAPGYALELEVLDGRIDAPAGQPVVLHAPPGKPLRVRFSALTGETPLTPLDAAQLFAAGAGSDPRSRQALSFLSYREKLLAGSWRFDTYFGRDTLMSLQLLLPALAPDAVEAGLGAVLARLDGDGEVAHEEAIGEFAVLRHRQRDGRDDATPLYDYGMVDDDFMLAPVAAAWLLDSADGRARAAAFLARTTPAGESYGAALARNLSWVVERSAAFAETPRWDRLIALQPGHDAGQWRDSEHGLGGGRYAYDVNAVFVPAALRAIARLQAQGLLRPYLGAEQAQRLQRAAGFAERWQRHAPVLFAVERPPAQARAAVGDYARVAGVDPAPALAALPRTPLRFAALALDADGRPLPVLHSDGGFALLMLDPSAAELDALVATLLRPFPAGLMTDIGLLVANPAYAPALQPQFGADAYHGTVVWSWQQAVLAAGLERQLQRPDLPAATRTRLLDARQRLWTAIDAAHAVRTSELWTWTYADGRYAVRAFGQAHGDADESNAAQLWSTVFLALRPPAP